MARLQYVVQADTAASMVDKSVVYNRAFREVSWPSLSIVFRYLFVSDVGPKCADGSVSK